MARMAKSAAVEVKAAGLPVRWAGSGAHGEGLFAVASGSEPGKVYQVTALDPRDLDRPALLDCDCAWAANGGRACSHARAVSRWSQAQQAKRARAARLAARQTVAAVTA